MTDAMTPARGRGRPPTVSTERLRTEAIALIERVGYERATMEAIAEATGVSSRTLHRHFASKADIIWSGTEASLISLSEGFATVDDTLSLLDAISHVIRSTFFHSPEESNAMRARLRLIATIPELRSVRSALFTGWHQEIAAFIGRRRGESPTALVPTVSASTIQETIMSALTWWAVNEDPGTAGDVVTEAFAGTFDL